MLGAQTNPKLANLETLNQKTSSMKIGEVFVCIRGPSSNSLDLNCKFAIIKS